MARKKNLDLQDLALAEQEYAGGLNVDQVSKKLSFNRTEVSSYLRTNGLLRKMPGRITWVGTDHIRCSKCLEVKPLDQIVYNTNNAHLKNGSYLSYCKACRVLQSRGTLAGRPVPWAKRLSRIRSRCDQSGVEFALTPEYMVELHQRQAGKCVYTREDMIDEFGIGSNPRSVSVDRIDYQLGYVPGNVVLCTMRANTIKHNQTLEELAAWMPVWHERLTRFMEET